MSKDTDQPKNNDKMTIILSQLTNHLIKQSEVQEKTKAVLIQFYQEKEKAPEALSLSPQVKRKAPVADEPEVSSAKAHYGT